MIAAIAAARRAQVSWADDVQSRGRALMAIAEQLDQSVSALVEIADLETGLGVARLPGEVTRTTFQIREFASAIASNRVPFARNYESVKRAPFTSANFGIDVQ
jgi:acyl-CoA reductase-like NAD-dependent aldehyde dehydrogenase